MALVNEIVLRASGPNGFELALPYGPVNVQGLGLDYMAGDIRLTGQVRIGCGVYVAIVLKHDGSWVHFKTTLGSDEGCHYLHFAMDGTWDRENRKPPTEAQRRAVARWWLGFDAPYGMGPGGPLVAWAFQGMTPDEVSREYGDGSPVYLA